MKIIITFITLLFSTLAFCQEELNVQSFEKDGKVYYVATGIKRYSVHKDVAFRIASSFSYEGIKGWRIPTKDDAIAITEAYDDKKIRLPENGNQPMYGNDFRYDDYSIYKKEFMYWGDWTIENVSLTSETKFHVNNKKKKKGRYVLPSCSGFFFRYAVNHNKIHIRIEDPYSNLEWSYSIRAEQCGGYGRTGKSIIRSYHRYKKIYGLNEYGPSLAPYHFFDPKSMGGYILLIADE